LRDLLARDQIRVALDLDDAADRDELVALLESADVVVDGNTPRVFANVGLDDDTLRLLNPRLSIVRLAAFAGEDRPGYGLAAECRGGWAARLDPPRLARTSVADPVGGLLAALAAVDALGQPGARARVSLEGAVGLLLAASPHESAR
jgi:crotonobetainyl-CoA:carnitine CoA-transferase CaiB-like acyl-CoA transferase